MSVTEFDLFFAAQDCLSVTLDVGRLTTEELKNLRTEALEVVEEEKDLVLEGKLAEADTNTETLQCIISTIDEIEQAMGDETFDEGVEMIRENCFEDHAQQLADELRGPGDADLFSTWPTSCIDWERAAQELSHDYGAVEIAGATYYYRG